MPTTAAKVLGRKLYSAASSELQQGKGSLLSQIVSKYLPGYNHQQQQCSSVTQLATAGCTLSRRSKHFLSPEEDDFLRSAATHNLFSSSSGSNSPSSSGRGADSTGGAAARDSSHISPSCDVPGDHKLHELYRARRQHVETAGSNTSLYKLPSRITSGTISPEEFQKEEHVLSRFYGGCCWGC
jgi:hypothetical protein